MKPIAFREKDVYLSSPATKCSLAGFETNEEESDHLLTRPDYPHRAVSRPAFEAFPNSLSSLEINLLFWPASEPTFWFTNKQMRNRETDPLQTFVSSRHPCNVVQRLYHLPLPDQLTPLLLTDRGRSNTSINVRFVNASLKKKPECFPWPTHSHHQNNYRSPQTEKE